MTSQLIIDVSNVNPATEVDVKNSKSVALICKATEGTNFKDKTLAAHRKIAKALNIPFGSYVFVHPGSGAAQATEYLKYAKPKKGDIEPILDVEVQDGESFRDVAVRVDEIAKVLEAKGYRPILYASTSFWQQLFAADPKLKRLRVWQAEYPGRLTRWFPNLAIKRHKLRHGVTVVMWQWTDHYTAGKRSFDCSRLMTPLANLLIK